MVFVFITQVRNIFGKKKKKKDKKKNNPQKPGVPVVAQQLMNPTTIHEDEGLIPGLVH